MTVIPICRLQWPGTEPRYNIHHHPEASFANKTHQNNGVTPSSTRISLQSNAKGGRQALPTGQQIPTAATGLSSAASSQAPFPCSVCLHTFLSPNNLFPDPHCCPSLLTWAFFALGQPALLLSFFDFLCSASFSALT